MPRFFGNYTPVVSQYYLPLRYGLSNQLASSKNVVLGYIVITANPTFTGALFFVNFDLTLQLTLYRIGRYLEIFQTVVRDCV
jgi:hypothetical protein